MIYGWKKDLPDQRDVKFTYQVMPLPEKVDLRPEMPPVYNQGLLGSCTANAGGASFAYMHKKLEDLLFMPSRLFIYYNTRRLDGTIKYDAGSTIRATMKAMAKYGAPQEILWPYEIEKFKAKPAATVYADGKKNLVTQYLRVPQTEAGIKTSLAQGFPIVFGFSVYESFEAPEVIQTGVAKMPTLEESLVGGHAVMIVGYDDAEKMFIVRNSWGEQWGDKGYFYMPYEYVLHRELSADFWTIRIVI